MHRTPEQQEQQATACPGAPRPRAVQRAEISTAAADETRNCPFPGVERGRVGMNHAGRQPSELPTRSVVQLFDELYADADAVLSALDAPIMRDIMQLADSARRLREHNDRTGLWPATHRAALEIVAGGPDSVNAALEAGERSQAFLSRFSSPRAVGPAEGLHMTAVMVARHVRRIQTLMLRRHPETPADGKHDPPSGPRT